MELDKRVINGIINDSFSLRELLSKNNPDARFTYGEKCFCPFHHNEHTEAAVLYNDNGSESLYCFAEQKKYTAVDVLTKLMGYNSYELGYALFNSKSKVEQKLILEKYSDNYALAFSLGNQLSKTKNIFDSPIISKAALMFKEKTLDLKSYLNFILEEEEK